MSTRERQSCLQSLRRFFCCTPAPDASVVDPISIVLPTAAPQSPPEALPDPAEIQWKEVDNHETLRQTVKSEPGKTLLSSAESTGKEPSFHAFLRALEMAEAGDTMRNPMQSYAEEGIAKPPEELSIVKRLKYKGLPSVQPQGKIFLPGRPFPAGIPLKPMTPSVFHGKTRIPTAKPRPTSLPQDSCDHRIRATSPL